MPRSLTVLVLLTAVCLSTACGDDDDDLPTNPTPPVQVSETVSGTLNPFSARNHEFLAGNPGEVRVTVTALNPDDPTTVGLSVGTWNGVACQVVVDRNVTPLNGAVIGTATSAGTLCARIYDSSASGLPAPVEYTLTILHF
jgi:hypothetical protein